jgi:hypothetical protein
MRILLEALELHFSIEGDYLTLNCSKNELVYAINSAGEDIQYIYGLTREWKKLTQLYQ